MLTIYFDDELLLIKRKFPCDFYLHSDTTIIIIKKGKILAQINNNWIELNWNWELESLWIEELRTNGTRMDSLTVQRWPNHDGPVEGLLPGWGGGRRVPNYADPRGHFRLHL